MKVVAALVAALACLIGFCIYRDKYFFVGLPSVLAKFLLQTDPYHEVTWKRTEQSNQRPDVPNIILIVADDLGYNDISGGAGVATPHIDSIAQAGVNYVQAYAGHATCSPSRAALLTGKFPSRIGFDYTPIPVMMSWIYALPNPQSPIPSIFHYDKVLSAPPMGDMIIPLSETLISNLLKDYGNYSTMYLGKWHLGEKTGAQPQERGFEETLAFLKGASLYLPVDHPEVVNAPLNITMDEFLLRNLRTMVQFNGGNLFPANEYMTDYLTREAIRAIESKGNHPYFMVVAYNAPHNPLQALRSDYEDSEVSQVPNHPERVYAAMIKALDRGVGRILQAVEASPQADNTLIIFTSDNGGAPYLKFPNVNQPFRGWKATFFEGGIRVPLFMSWPKVIPKNTALLGPVSHVDIFATIAAAARLHKVQASVDGVNLLDYVDEFQPFPDSFDQLDHANKVRSYADPCNAELAIWHNTLRNSDSGELVSQSCKILRRPHENLFFRSSHYLSLRHDDWKLQVALRPNRVWLFDLLHDPTEKNNLVWGLRWTALQPLLGDPIRCATVVKSHANLSTTKELESLSTIVCGMAVQLTDYNRNEAAPPLWPSLVEVPVLIDPPKDGLVRSKEDVDYVSWAN